MSKELQQKLFHFEEQPPVEAWHKIAEALDANKEQPFSERLFHYQTTPPPHTWDEIAKNLHEATTPVIPIKRPYTKILRYGSVAAILLVAVVSVNLFLNKNATGGDTAAVTTETNSKPSDSSLSPETTNQPPSTGTNLIAKATVADSQKPQRRKKSYTDYPIAPLQAKQTSPAFDNWGDEVIPKQASVLSSDIPDRYIIFSKATGEAIRLSKKLFSLFACSDEVEDCKEDIESIQQRMASPTIMASADFNGVLDALQNMNNP